MIVHAPDVATTTRMRTGRGDADQPMMTTMIGLLATAGGMMMRTSARDVADPQIRTSARAADDQRTMRTRIDHGPVVWMTMMTTTVRVGRNAAGHARSLR